MQLAIPGSTTSIETGKFPVTEQSVEVPGGMFIVFIGVLVLSNKLIVRVQLVLLTNRTP